MVTERIPSCDRGLVEDFKQNKCVAKLMCGGLGQRPCLVTERIPSCDKGLAEDFKQNKCLTRVPCGRLGERPCVIVERIPSCDAGLVENAGRSRCVRPQQHACGGSGQRPCLIIERIPSCNSGLLEDFAHNRCVPAKDLVGAIAVESCKAALKAHQKIMEIQSAIAAQQQAAVGQLRKDQKLVDTVLQAAERVQKERKKLFDELDAAANVFISPANVGRFQELLNPERLCDTPVTETWRGLRAILVKDPRGAELLKRGSYLLIGTQFAGAKGLGIEFGYGLAIVLPDIDTAGTANWKSPGGPRYWIYVFVGGLGTPGVGGSAVAQVGLFRGTPAPGSAYMALGWSRPFGKDTSGGPKGDTRFLPVVDLFFDFPVQEGRWAGDSVDWFAAHMQGAVVSVGAAFDSKSYTRAGDILGDWALQGGYAWSFPLDR